MKKDIDLKNVDIVSLKKRKRRRRQTAKFITFLAIVLVGIIAYVKIDDWFPNFEDLGTKFKSVRPGEGVSEGNFPLRVSGGIDYQVADLDGYLAILSDAYLYIYDISGSVYDERQHAYANAMMQTSEKQVLIYESGGNHFRVDSRRKNMYEKKIDNQIMFARLCDNGYVAVISSSDSFVCRLTVFDDEGNEIYSRDCVERVIDIDFTDNGTGCILATTYTSNGKFASKLISVAFDSKEDKWTSDEFGGLCLKVHYDNEGFFVIGEDKCAYYNDSGKAEMSYDYPSKLIDWDFSSNGAALLFKNETKRQSYFTTISSEKKTPNEKSFDNSEVKCIRFSGSSVLVMNKDGINRYGFKGSDETNITSDTSYDKFVIVDDYIFMLGYDRIDRIKESV